MKRLGLPASLKETEKLFHDHTGFVLYDLEKKKTIYSFNGEKYFTPASNTKIFTFYTSLRILGDSVPALRYVVRNDSMIFRGTGDPSFLYRYTFNNDRVYNFLKSSPYPPYFSARNFYTPHFGEGWSWDDYNSAYSSEKSPMPVYGNILTLRRNGPIFEVQPPYLAKEFAIGERRKREVVIRDINGNSFRYHPGTNRAKNPPEWDVPIKVSPQLTAALLSDTLNRPVTLVSSDLPPFSRQYFSIPTDSLYRVMMQDSDNFIAEQLLLLCSDVVRDSLDTEIAIRYALENYLHELPDKAVWVDGSGLSRYNLFTPRSIVRLWEMIYDIVPRERLFSLVAVGGRNGTIRNSYRNDTPYIFGKTGTLSNNHTLSGYLVTRSGKTLIFSFMNNNFVTSTSEIRRNMERILYTIYEKYK